MRECEIEFRKGVLFVRVEGNLDEDLKEVDSIIENIGIKYIVLNVDRIKHFNLDDINSIVNYNKYLLKENKKMMICDKQRKIFKNITNIKCELEVFPLI